jgi:non-ribosomal peptide synthetase component F
VLTRRELPWTSVASDRPYATVVTAFAALVHRRTGVRDLVVGLPTSLRHEAEAAGVIGCFVNPAPLRLQWDAEATFGDLLEHTADRLIEVIDHSRLPFDELVRHLGLRARPGRSFLLDLGVTWEAMGLTDQPYELEDILAPQALATSDLWVYAARYGDRLRLDLVADANLILPEELDALADELADLVSEVAVKPGAPVSAPGAATPSPRPRIETRYDF